MVYIWMLRLILRQKEENIDKVPVCQTTSDFGTEGFHGAPITKVQPSPLPSQAFIKSFYISNFNSWFTHDMAECSISSGCSLPRIEMGLNTLYHEFWKTKFKENFNILLQPCSILTCDTAWTPYWPKFKYLTSSSKNPCIFILCSDHSNHIGVEFSL